jgi:hypothetical protein
MRRRIRYLEGVSLAVVAVFLIVAGVLHVPSSLHLHGQTEALVKRSTIISDVAICYGFVLALAAVSSFLLAQWGETTLTRRCLRALRAIAEEAACAWHWCRKSTNTKPAYLVPPLLIGAAVRGYFLAQPMRYDEAVTFLAFVNQSVAYLFYYPFPNNHVLHTLLVRLSVGFFGGHPISIRLPAFLAGLCVIPAISVLAGLLSRNASSGLVAAGLTAVYPFLVLYDTMARGYSLLVLLSVCLAILGYRLIERPSLRLCGLISLVTASGLLVMPSFLMPGLAILLWAVTMLAYHRRAPAKVIAGLAASLALMTMGLTGLFYTPTILVTNGLQPILDNQFVRGIAWPDFVQKLPHHLLMTAHDFTRDIPGGLLIVGVLLAVVGYGAMVRSRDWNSITFFPFLAIGAAIMLIAKHAIPFPRTWIYLLPFLFVLIDAGFCRIVDARDVLVRTGVVAGIGLFAVLLMTFDAVSSYDDTGCFQEAPVVVSVLAREMEPGDDVVVDIPADAPVEYYLWQKGIPRTHGGDDVANAKKFFIVKKSWYTLSRLTTLNARKVLELGDAQLYVYDPKVDGTRGRAAPDKK